VRVLTNDEHIWLPAAVGYAREALINWFIANGFDQYAGFHQRLYDGFRAVFGADPVNR
jgi:hypothetical protein